MIRYSSRTKFRDSLNATCKNAQWSWSWVSHQNKKVYFGVSSIHERKNSQLILGRNWRYNKKNQVKHGYPEAIENISLVLNDGYKLFTFRQREKIVDQETGRVTITHFEQDLEERVPFEKNDGWHAVLHDDFDGIESAKSELEKIVYLEGSKVPISGSNIERNSRAREACLSIHGYKCLICKFDFEERYGELGKDFIHVHHLKPLSETKERHVINPEHDLCPVCPNCHSMIHRNGKNRSIDHMQELLK